jgi:hypothetical protein
MRAFLGTGLVGYARVWRVGFCARQRLNERHARFIEVLYRLLVQQAGGV